MVDIHTHILHSTDDGARNVEASIAMGRQEAAGGTTTIVATPHIYSAQDIRKSPEFVARVEKLQEEFNHEQVGITLVQGAEVYPIMDILDALDDGMPITLGPSRKFILLDLPLQSWPLNMEQIIFEIFSRGITPILAHPERTSSVQQSLEFLVPYLERGVLLQVNAGSLTGAYGPVAQKRVNEILARKWASFIASDMHRAKDKPALRTAVDLLRDLPKEYVDQISTRNPQAAVLGQPIASVDPSLIAPVPKKSRLGQLFKR